MRSIGSNCSAIGRATAAAEYYAAYFLEESLSLDNIFVFAIVFSELLVIGAVVLITALLSVVLQRSPERGTA